MRTVSFPSMHHPLARALAAALALAVTPLAVAADRAPSRSRGFVDGSAFAALAGEDSEVVEINIQAPLLKALARADAGDEGLGSFVRKLESVSAYIVALEGDPRRTERATRMVREMEAKLERDGWQRLAVVREKAARVNVYIRNNDEVIDGLVVLVVDPEESRVVFANIAGTLDLADLGKLQDTLDLPGLDALGEAVEKGQKKER